jgi:hypothetical protein
MKPIKDIDKEQLLCEVSNIPAYMNDLIQDLKDFTDKYCHVLPANEREQFHELEVQLRLALSHIDEADATATELLFAHQ